MSPAAVKYLLDAAGGDVVAEHGAALTVGDARVLVQIGIDRLQRHDFNRALLARHQDAALVDSSEFETDEIDERIIVDSAGRWFFRAVFDMRIQKSMEQVQVVMTRARLNLLDDDLGGKKRRPAGAPIGD